MKKLLAIAAITFVATVANAASCSWSATAIAKDPTGGAATSYYAYLIDASVVSLSDMTAALSNNDTSLLSSSSIIGSASTVAQGTTGNARLSATLTSNAITGAAFSAGDLYSMYTIILNSADKDAATYYMATPQLSNVKVPDAGNLQAGFSSQASNSWQTMAVPEPTSGLLMLLGMAGLALRRRRA